MLWVVFAVSILLCLLLLYAPGVLLLRGAGALWFPSLALAPAVSVAIVGIVCILLPEFGIFCSGFSVLLVLAGICCLLMVMAFFARRSLSAASVLGSSGGEDERRLLLMSGIVAFFGAFLGCVFFLGNLESPDSFFQAFDNCHHVNGIAEFVDTGDWSSFSPAFYPSGLHDVAAILCSCLDLPSTVALNALIYTFSFVVFPLNMLFLTWVIFPEKPVAAFAGGMLSTCFVAFPWQLLLFGPLYPNLAALAVLPSAMALYMLVLRSCCSKSFCLIDGVVFLAACLALFLLQPNTLFSAVVFLAVWTSIELSRFVSGFRVFSRRRALTGVLVFCLCGGSILFVIAVLYKTSFIQNLLTDPGYCLFGIREAISHAFNMSFMGSIPQYTMAFLVLSGSLYSILRERTYLWVTASVAVSMLMFVLASTDSPELLRNFLTGYWYHDAYRIAANTVVFCVPLAALGFSMIYGWIRSIAISRFSGIVWRGGFAFCLAIGLVLVVNYWPKSMGDASVSSFESVADSIRNCYSFNDAACVLTEDEASFADQVKLVVGDGDLIINVPDDGSAFLYGTDGLNVMYRATRIWSPDTEAWEKRTIRAGLCDVSTDQDVAKAVDSLGAKYVLLLDQGAEGDDSERVWFFTWRWYSDWWAGITSVSDDTPGFELVLSDGDMRLYKIGCV